MSTTTNYRGVLLPNANADLFLYKLMGSYLHRQAKKKKKNPCLRSPDKAYLLALPRGCSCCSDASVHTCIVYSWASQLILHHCNVNRPRTQWRTGRLCSPFSHQQQPFAASPLQASKFQCCNAAIVSLLCLPFRSLIVSNVNRRPFYVWRHQGRTGDDVCTIGKVFDISLPSPHETPLGIYRKRKHEPLRRHRIKAGSHRGPHSLAPTPSCDFYRPMETFCWSEVAWPIARRLGNLLCPSLGNV